MYSATLSAGAAGQDINPEWCQARARHGQLLAAVSLAGLLWSGFASAAGYTWDGNGSVNASGNWGTAANWNPDGIPAASDTVLLPDVTTGTRTVTNEAARSATALTLTQTTAGATNKLVLGANLSLPSAVNVAFSGSGPTEIDIGNFTFSAFGGIVDRTYASNITWRSSGGTLIDTWNGSPTSFNLQGNMYLTAGTTTATFYRTDGFRVDTTGMLNLTGSAVFHYSQATQKALVSGTLSGDGTGTFRTANMQVNSGAQVSGLANVITNNFDFRATDPTKFDFTGTTLKLYSAAGAGTYEVMSDTGSSNYRLGTLDLRGYNNSQIKLVDNYNNDPTAVTSERVNVTTFYAHNNNPLDTFDLNGLELYINNSIAGYTAPASYGRIGNSAGTGKISFATAGGALGVGQIFITNGSTLQITGPASISAVDPGADTSNGAGFNGTFRFGGNVTGRFVTTGTGPSAVDLSGNTLTLGISSAGPYNNRLYVSPGTTLTLTGNVNNTAKLADTISGMVAAGMTKTGASGPPTVAAGATLVLTGNYKLNNPTNGSGDPIGGTEIGRLATLKVGGDFVVENLHNNIYETYNRYLWRVNTSQDAGTLVFNGGGTTQLWELNSKDYLTFAGLDYYQKTGAALSASQTVTGATSGATATITDVVGSDQIRLSGVSGTFQADETLTFSGGGTARAYNANYTGLASAQTDGGAGATSRAPYGTVSIGDPAGSVAAVQLVNNYTNSYYGSVETMQVARSLTVTAGSTLDLNGYQMTVPLGSATVKGLVTDTYGAGRTSTLLLADNASLTVDSGTVAVDQLTLNAGSNLSLVGGATLSNTAFTLAGTNTVTNTSGTNTIANSMTLNGPLTFDAPPAR